MEITTKGIILALKNLGGWLAAYTISGIKASPEEFLLGLVVYIMITTPSDLFLLNHLSDKR